jgi:retinol dehydrogenase 12
MADLSGRIVLITGGARGMGRITAEALAAMGAHVIVADWEGEHGARTVAAINAAGKGSAEFIYCNVAEPDSVRELAAKVLKRHDRLHVLVNNAGITYPRRQLNEDGVEMHFATCHLGHFLLTRLLLERLRASAPARILFIASEGHKAARGLDFDDLNNEKIWKGKAVDHGAAFMAYARAKLCNLHVMRELAARLDGSGVTVNAVSPGYFVNTGIHREMQGIFRWGALLVFGIGSLFGLSTPEKGARTHIWAASAPELEAVSGRYFQACREITPSPHVDDAAERARIWQLSEAMAGLA